MAEKTLLVADDDELILRSMKRLLSGVGYDVITVGDASAAIDVLRDPSISVDMILSDNDMGYGLTGLDFAALVRGKHDPADHRYAVKTVPEFYRDVPFALVTGGGDLDGKYGRATALGIEFVEKSFDPDDLLSMLDEYLR